MENIRRADLTLAISYETDIRNAKGIIMGVLKTMMPKSCAGSFCKRN
jgi:hypothetical protein